MKTPDEIADWIVRLHRIHGPGHALAADIVGDIAAAIAAERAELAQSQKARVSAVQQALDFADKYNAERVARETAREAALREAAEAVVKKAREIGRQECCGRGVPSTDNQHEECCGTPDLMLTDTQASDAILALIPQEPKPRGAPMADLSDLPRDLYVTEARKVDAVVVEASMCSVPMAIGPEVRYVRADMQEPKPHE